MFRSAMLQSNRTAAGPLLSDSFTDVNGTDVTAHTPDIGPMWSYFGYSGAASLTISANTLKFNSTSGFVYAYAYRDSGVSDGIATCNVKGNGEMILQFRFKDLSNFWHLHYNASNGIFQVRKKVAGINYTVVSTTVAGNTSTWYALAVTLNGASITCTLDGANQLSTTDTFLQAETIFGVSNGWSNAPSYFDDFSVNAL